MAWNEQAALQKTADDAKAEFKAAKHAFGSCMPPDLFNALDNLERVVAEQGILGVHGPLVDLVSCANKFFKAAEVRPSCANKFFKPAEVRPETPAFPACPAHGL